MPTYSLKAIISPEIVSFLNRNDQRIVIVKKNEKSKTNVAWVTFKPFQVNNVTWNTEYGIYASNVQIQNGATIDASSYSEASVKNMYPFQNGVFDSPISDSELKDNEYAIHNKSDEYEYLTFGLAQDVTANGTNYEGNPINAESVLYNQTVSFIPNEKICVFIESSFNDGTIITHIRSNVLNLDFTDDANVTIKYDKSIGGFVKQN
ncbi:MULTISPECIES: hypothetical protein [Clostridium]|uniref:Uncharacterized protein n=1 Tax=Clostridium cibarium TaxID=2762247 RepID=A0ABR8PVN5_9CLOT|nr:MULTISPECIES: hypothetical protein [Clostridium]MBD7912205.1 hypothetical protein [Clostridium cibarium]